MRAPTILRVYDACTPNPAVAKDDEAARIQAANTARGSTVSMRDVIQPGTRLCDRLFSSN